MKEISSKDAVFTVHIEGREAVELEGVEIVGFAESHPDKILVDRAFMQMAYKVNDLLKQRAELLEALKYINRFIEPTAVVAESMKKHAAKAIAKAEQ